MADSKKNDLNKDEMKKVSGGKVINVEPPKVDKVRNKSQAGGSLKRMAPDRERPTRER